MTGHLEPLDPDNLSLVAASDALLHTFAAGAGGEAGGPDDELTALLASWRAELDERADSLLTERPTVTARPARWVRAHRRTAAVTAVVVALAASTSVAAAASGPTGPLGELHQLFFGSGDAAHHIDGSAVRVSRILGNVEDAVETARAAGFVTVAQKRELGIELNNAGRLLAGDRLAPRSLTDRLFADRTAVAALHVQGPAATTPADEHGGYGTDDAGTSDHSGAGGHDGGGSQDGGSGSGSGDTGSTSSGSDGSGDATQSGTSSSDGGSGDTSSVDGGSGTSGSGGSGDTSSVDGGAGTSGSGSSSSGSGDSGTD